MVQFTSLITYIIPLISGLITFVLFIRTFKEYNQHGIRCFSAIMLVYSIYSIAYFLEIISNTLSVATIFLFVQQISAFFIAPFTILFVSSFLKKVKLTKLLEKLVFIPPTIFVIGLLSNEYHQLYFISIEEVENFGFFKINSEKSVLYWMHNIYTVILTLIGSFLLFTFIISAPTLQVTSLMLVLFSINIGLLSLIFTTFGLVNIPYDLMPLTFLVSGMILYYTLNNYDIFNTIPLNFKRILNNLNKGIIIISPDGKLVYFNMLSTKILFDKTNKKFTILELKSKYPQILDEKNRKFKILQENKNGKTKSIQIEISSLNSTSETVKKGDIKIIYIEDISSIEEFNLEYSKTQHENKLFLTLKPKSCIYLLNSRCKTYQ